ncbi:hypothetical protein PUN28_005828 [Cardiocondyla obscurior]|uniref:Uncharacterized protein n=1 Tax=Cardiocondyla obscurior TaxID=286306 RepID=A0AAW2G9F4_9HYME
MPRLDDPPRDAREVARARASPMHVHVERSLRCNFVPPQVSSPGRAYAVKNV